MAIDEGFATRLHQLAVSLFEKAMYAEAEQAFALVVEAAPDHADMAYNHAACLSRLERADAAAAACRGIVDDRGLEHRPSLRLLVQLEEAAGRLEAAARYAARLLVLDPRDEAMWLLVERAGPLEDVQARLVALAASRPADGSLASRLAVMLFNTRQHAAAKDFFCRAVCFDPGNPTLIYAIGRNWESVGRPDLASHWLRRAFEAGHDDAGFSRGILFQGYQHFREAVAVYDALLDRVPGHTGASANQALSQLYIPGVSAADVLALRRRWYARIPRPAQMPAAAAKPADGFTIGFVSGDFYAHQMGFLSIRAVEGLAALGVRVICYAGGDEEDWIAARFRAAAAKFHRVGRMSDDDLAALIRADGVDVLVDMAGHFARNRLPVFMRRPAPLSVTWPCCTGTTGMPEMDVIVADRCEIPPELEQFYAERVLRMPESWIVWEPPPWAPDVGPLPAGGGAPFTFGSLSNPDKLNASVAALWTRVLEAVPGSRLLLSYNGMTAPHIAPKIRERFAAAGADPSRIVLENGTPKRRDFLDTYNRIDVVLDPYPYSGGITVLEALWMGCPVVSLPSETFPGRHAISILSTLGFPEWAPPTAEGYVAAARTLASSSERLRSLRAELRQRVAASPLCDGRRFAAAFLGLLRGGM